MGALRFRAPQPVDYGSEPTLVDCTSYGKACMQPIPTSGHTSENCLYLNIWTPTVNKTAGLPVMVYIHGGGFTIGSGHPALVDTFSISNVYGGAVLALRDVIVVNFNYRLGVFGFLYANSSHSPGNMGLWDQSMALNWTTQNIRLFGGDPQRITLFGESAGSISISKHLVSNVTRNWFQRVIMQSGSAFNKMWEQDVDYSYRVGRRFATDASLWPDNGSCYTSEGDDIHWVQCLRQKTAEQLLWAQTQSGLRWLPRDPWITVGLSTYFKPIFGDQFLPRPVMTAVKAGDFRRDITIVLGHNEMEGAIITTLVDLYSGLMGRYLPFVPRPPLISQSIVFNDIQNVLVHNKSIAGRVAAQYTDPFNSRLRLQLNPTPIRQSAVHMFGDYALTCPTILFGAYAVRAPAFTGKVFQYRLKYGSTQSLASYSTWADVSHTDELPLVFGLPFKPYERLLWSDRDRRLSKHVMDVWTHFAKSGEVLDMNGNVWPEYEWNSDENRVDVKYMEFDANERLMGRVGQRGYDGYDGTRGSSGHKHRSQPTPVNNCFNFWDQLLSEQF
ncbi:unnamed protein product [Medioppia subpectinata]|uniref:Carboxylic ester hydrolase n=1 Tax=Medioppia subpectinata TaxID=1979941 RepID=A0A7R9PVM4_9ACAR|nr:unnamed protein product [Medioppia subpectinata]CAG2101959.1 unnamed protein product [Medioppia subpectinata]